MNRYINISYSWWIDKGEIKESHIPALEETAEELIFNLIKEGFTSGELHDNILMDDDDGDCVEYSGWWELERKEN